MRLDLCPAMTLPAPDAPRVLIADDQVDVLDALRLLLHPEGILTEAVQSPAGVLNALREREYDVLLMDLNYARDTTSGREGLDLLSRVRAIDPALPVLVMTGWATLDIAIEAMRYGVSDFVQKPWENERVIASIRGHAEARRGARKAAARRAREQAEARQIQQGLLPQALPAVDGWELAAACEPAESVGGDTYDVIRLDDCRLGLSLGDVSGKGIPAALLAANLQAAVRSAAARALQPAALCAEVNRALCASVGSGRFVTYFYGVLDASTGQFSYCNAGHNPPLVLRPDGSVERLEAGGMVLGIDSSAPYAEETVTLAPGDRLVLYTDGVVEARNPAGEEYGEPRLAATSLLSGLAVEQAAVNEGFGRIGSPVAQGFSPARGSALVQAIMADLRAFSGNGREDDQTLLVALRLATS